MTFSAQNRELLQRRFPGLAERLDQAAPEPELRTALAATASGHPTLTVGGVLVHSPRDPVREAEKLAAAADGKEPVILLGFGLGYLAEALRRRDGNRAILIVERHEALLAAAFAARDLADLLAHENLAFMVGGDSDGILSLLQLFSGAPRIMANRTLRNRDALWYDEVENRVATWIAKDDVNAATLRRFGKRWVRNLARNLEALRDIPGVAGFAGCAQGLPALVLAAGPSLDAVLPYLPRLAERCVIVAVDTALRAALAVGVDPDFVLVVDPQFWNARHLDRCPGPHSYLITESAVFPSVLRHDFASRFLCSTLFPLGRFIEDRLDPKGALGAGGSVATSAWDFTRLLGAGPVWIAGLDLSFPGLKTHFKGALFEERALAEADRLCPAETRSFRALRDGRPYPAAAADGSTVLTDRRLSLYAAWFAHRFRQMGTAAPRSLSGRGLALDGFAVAALEELLALPRRRPEIRRALAAAAAAIGQAYGDAGAARSRETRFERALAELLAGLAEMASLAGGAEKTAADALRTSGAPADRERSLEALDRAHQAISANSAKDVAGFLLPPLEALEARLSIDTRDPFGRHLELSALLYGALAGAAEYHLKVLSNFIKARRGRADNMATGNNSSGF